MHLRRNEKIPECRSDEREGALTESAVGLAHPGTAAATGNTYSRFRAVDPLG